MQSLLDFIHQSTSDHESPANRTHSDDSIPAHLRRRTVSSCTLPARLLLSILRLSGRPGEISRLDRCVLDCLGRILDSSGQRQQTIAAVNQISTIALTRTRVPLKILQATSTVLSDDEQLLMDAASLHLRGRHSMAVSRLQWLMDSEASRQFLESIDIIGKVDCFRQFGPHALALCPASIQFPDKKDDMTHTSVIQCAQLSTEERLIVNFARLWVKCIALRINSLAAVQRLSACLGLSGLNTTLHDILHRTAYHAIRQFDVRCLCCEEVSPDEARLLATLAAFDRGCPGESVEHLNTWLPLTSIQGVLAQVAGNRRKLFEHVNTLPSRQWDFKGLVQRQILFDQNRSAQAEHSVH